MHTPVSHDNNSVEACDSRAGSTRNGCEILSNSNLAHSMLAREAIGWNVQKNKPFAGKELKTSSHCTFL
jgi:hypothetical protein